MNLLFEKYGVMFLVKMMTSQRLQRLCDYDCVTSVTLGNSCCIFLYNILSDRTKANIVNETLIRLFEVGTITMSITCDGPAGNFSMLNVLGCCLEDSHSTYFSFQQICIKQFTAFSILVIC